MHQILFRAIVCWGAGACEPFPGHEWRRKGRLPGLLVQERPAFLGHTFGDCG